MQKNPALDPSKNLKIRQDDIDFDYLHLLDAEALAWQNKFMEEWNNASFDKTNDGDFSDSNLHNTAKLRSECYKRNNARNNDIFSRAKAKNALVYDNQEEEVLEDYEDTVIDLIDKKIESEKLLEDTYFIEEVDTGSES